MHIISEAVRGTAVTRKGYMGMSSQQEAPCPAAVTDGGAVCIQVGGVFGLDCSVGLLGSNDGTEYAPLSDPQGNILLFRKPGIKQVAEKPAFILPVVTGGDDTTAVNVILIVRSDV